MKLTALLLSGLFFSFFLGCTSQKYTPDTYTESQIRFGSGGGVTGAIKTYCLLDNGRLFVQQTQNDEFKALKKVSKKAYQKLFASAKELEIANMKFKQPGNFYHFIEIHENGSKNRIVWGSHQAEAPAGVEEFYRLLMNSGKKSTN